jgi:hypothetical protein
VQKREVRSGIALRPHEQLVVEHSDTATTVVPCAQVHARMVPASTAPSRASLGYDHRVRWVLLALGACTFSPGAGQVDGAGGGPGTPQAPAGLQVVAIDCTHVMVSWASSPGATGYTVYRDGTDIAATDTTSYVDAAVAASTSHAYAVAASDAAGTSTESPAMTAMTPACGTAAIRFVASGVNQDQNSPITVTMRGVVAGDLLVGWFLNYSSSSQVQVSDNLNSAWTRGCSETYDHGGAGAGDVALYYVESSKPGDVTVTVSGPNTSWMDACVGEFSGVATSNAFDLCSTAAASSATSSVQGSGPLRSPSELVFAAAITGQSAQSFAPGTSFMMGSSDHNDGVEAEVVSATTAPSATFTLGTSTDWNMVVATFVPAAP